MISVERGYNRDGDDLAQFNLGMFCDEVSKMPLYYSRYSGSLTDKTNLSCVLANAKAVGIEKVKMVLDGGFWSEDALCNLDKLCAAFSIGMPLHLKESEKAVTELGRDIAQYANELSNHHTYCLSKETEIHGINGRILLYFDAQNQVSQCKELSEHIERLKTELSKLKRYPNSKLKLFERYFKIRKHDNDSGFDFETDIDKIESLRGSKGFFLIFSTDMAASPDDILTYYRAKDADEKIFAQIKVDMDGDRVRTHNEATTDGKTFVTFVACVLRSYMLSKLSGYLATNSTSMKKTFNQLSSVIAIVENIESIRLVQALTKKQKAIIAAFDLLDNFSETLK
jgi:transposase